MSTFLVDEDLPRSLSRVLAAAGLAAADVRDVGLRGRADQEVYEYAVAHGMTLVTGDVGFANVLRYPLGRHAGIVVARFPNEMPVADLDEAILAGIRSLADDELPGSLVILQPGKIRLRRPR